MKVIQVGVESVLQNCVIGRCANLHIHILLHTVLLQPAQQHSTTCNHPKADISQFKILDQDRKQVSREAREAIKIRRNNPAINHNIGMMNIPKIFNQILNTDNTSSTEDSTNSNSQSNPSANSSNRATRATNLFN